MHDVAWRGRWICVRSKDAQKQLARTPLNYKHIKVLPQQGETAKARNEETSERAALPETNTTQDKGAWEILARLNKPHLAITIS